MADKLGALGQQIHGTDALTPAEVLSIHQRNGRHLDLQATVPCCVIAKTR